MAKFLPFMRVGIFKDRHGVNYDITKDVLKKVKENFDASNPPPLLIGHPDSKSVPTFGIVDALKIVKDVLYFRPAKYCAEFAALVARGGFPSVSAGLSQALDRLDHMAFLSAQKPAIDGFKPIAEFSACATSKHIDITSTCAGALAEFGAFEWWAAANFRTVGNILRGIKNNLIEQRGAVEADRLISDFDIDSLHQDPPEEDVEDSVAEYCAPAAGEVELDYKVLYNDLLPKYETAMREAAQFAATVSRLENEKTAALHKVVSYEKELRMAEFGALVEEAIAKGTALPDQRQATVERMEEIYSNSAPAEFAGATDCAKWPRALEIYIDDLKARPRIAPATGIAPPPEFARGDIDTNDTVAVGKAAARYRAEIEATGKYMSMQRAVDHVKGIR